MQFTPTFSVKGGLPVIRSESQLRHISCLLRT